MLIFDNFFPADLNSVICQKNSTSALLKTNLITDGTSRIMNFKCLICSSFETDHYKEIRCHFKNHFLRNHDNEYDKKPSNLEFLAMRSYSSKISVKRNCNLPNSCCLCLKSFLKYSDLMIHFKSTNHLNKLNSLKILIAKPGHFKSLDSLAFKTVLYEKRKLRCQTCKFNTNYLMKLKSHSSSIRHIILSKLSIYLQSILLKESSNDKQITLKCNVCNYRDRSLVYFIRAHLSLKCFVVIYGTELKNNFNAYPIRLFKVMFECEFEWSKKSNDRCCIIISFVNVKCSSCDVLCHFIYLHFKINDSNW